MPFYRFYLNPESPTPSDAATLANDEAAMMHAYGFLKAGRTVSVWDGHRHVAQLWAEPQPSVRITQPHLAADAPPGTSPRLDG